MTQFVRDMRAPDTHSLCLGKVEGNNFYYWHNTREPRVFMGVKVDPGTWELIPNEYLQSIPFVLDNGLFQCLAPTILINGIEATHFELPEGAMH